MKTLLITLVGLLVANLAMANATTEAHINYDGFATGVMLVIGIVCLVIARRRTSV